VRLDERSLSNEELFTAVSIIIIIYFVIIIIIIYLYLKDFKITLKKQVLHFLYQVILNYCYSQYLLFLPKEIPTIKKPEILYYVLQCLNTMALHGDALAKAAREQRGFFIWCQENLLIKK